MLIWYYAWIFSAPLPFLQPESARQSRRGWKVWCSPPLWSLQRRRRAPRWAGRPSCLLNKAAWPRRRGFAVVRKVLQTVFAIVISVPVPLRSTEDSFERTLFVFSYLRRDPDQQQPLLLLISSVVDDLTACQAGVPVENFSGLRVSLHAPVIDSRISHQGNGVHRYPLPEHDILWHSVSLQFTLHLDVEDLQRLGSWGEATEWEEEIQMTAGEWKTVLQLITHTEERERGMSGVRKAKDGPWNQMNCL